MLLEIHEVSGLHDPYLLDVLDIYQSSFPPNEQVVLSWWVHLLHAKEDSEQASSRHLLAALIQGTVIGMAYYEVYFLPDQIAHLWYLAIDKDQRGRGFGTQFYQNITSGVFQDGGGALTIEVEAPEAAAMALDRDGVDLAR